MDGKNMVSRSIRITSEAHDNIVKLAHERYLAPSTLIRTWIMERLAQETDPEW